MGSNHRRFPERKKNWISGYALPRHKRLLSPAIAHLAPLIQRAMSGGNRWATCGQWRTLGRGLTSRSAIASAAPLGRDRRKQKTGREDHPTARVPGLLFRAVSPRIPLQRKRRGSVEPLRYLPPGALIIATPPEHTAAGKSGRSTYQQSRRSKLSPEQIEAINRKSHLTLRELAAEYGVSHETIRAARRTADVGEESGSERRGKLSLDL